MESRKAPGQTTSRQAEQKPSSRRAENTEAVVVAPAAQSNHAVIDATSLDNLIAALRAFEETRGAEEDNEGQPQVLHAVCLTLIVGPTELGLDTESSSATDQALTDLAGVKPGDMPEAVVCRLWLLSAAGAQLPEAREQFAALARTTLWEPVRTLAYRALTQLGHRHFLASLLPSTGSLSLVQADAWLDAAHIPGRDDNWAERIVLPKDDILPALLCEQWRGLILAEAALAQGTLTDDGEAQLVSLSSLASDGAPQTYAEAESQRLGARAAAALARARLGSRRNCADVLNSGSAKLLPRWERVFLLALASWQSGEPANAIAQLEAALVLNPHQTAVRLALASLLATSSPEAGLNILDCDEPTREILDARATLMTRLGRYDEARNLLAQNEAAPGSEPARLSWPARRALDRQHRQALSAALAEQAGDWIGADQAWRGASGERGTLQEARQFFAAERELKTLSTGRQWRRGLVTQKLERASRELSTAAVTGDALFFRALALVPDRPKQACEDLRNLLHQRNWVKREQRVGGGRLLAAGDTLLRLGEVEDARRAYELANESSMAHVAERLAISTLAAAVTAGVDAAAIKLAADRATGLCPDSYWPTVIAALGLLMANSIEEAQTYVTLSEQHGAPEPVARALRAAVSGAAELSAEELAALPAPAETIASLRLLYGTGAETDRLEVFAETLGSHWLDSCPFDSAAAAKHLLARWCEGGQWEPALRTARELLSRQEPWAAGLAELVFVRHALMLAIRGELEAADEELRALAKAVE